jgi:transcription initiation factor TFIID subunit 12
VSRAVSSASAGAGGGGGAGGAGGGGGGDRNNESSEVLGKRKLQQLLNSVAPSANEKLQPEVEDLLLELVDDFIESTTTFACKLAAHRGSDQLAMTDVKLHLEKNWGIRVPGFGGDSARSLRRPSSDAHEKRLHAVRQTMARKTR